MGVVAVLSQVFEEEGAEGVNSQLMDTRPRGPRHPARPLEALFSPLQAALRPVTPVPLYCLYCALNPYDNVYSVMWYRVMQPLTVSP